MNPHSDGKTDISGGEHVARDSNIQDTLSLRPRRERVGLVVDGSNAAAAVKTIVSAEATGLRQVWLGQPPFWPDVLTTFAAAVATKTSIVPTYPRHYRPCSTGLGFTQSCAWPVAPRDRT
jgi:hypothetical protein